MKTKKLFFLVLSVVTLLTVSVSFVAAQEPPPPGPEGEVGVLASTYLSASPVMSYQGRLLENGSPVTGTKSMTFKLYDAQSAGTLVWTEGPKDVAVTNGLFNVTLGDTTALDVNNLDQELWLEITVASTILPRQKLMGAPYAFSLVPGADVTGSTVDSVLYARNNGTGDGLNGYNTTSGIGVHGQSNFGHGVRAWSYGTGLNGAALYATNGDAGGISLWAHNYSSSSTDAALVVGNDGSGPLIKGFGGDGGEDEFRVNNNGSIWSEANTEIAVSPLKMVIFYNSNVTLRPNGSGYMEVRPNASEIAYVYVPVDLPSVLLGTATKLKSVRVCYNVDLAASHITETTVNYLGDSSLTTLITDGTDRTSTAWECYTLTDTTPNEIQGSLFVRFVLNFTGTGSSHDIRIGRITLTLTEQ